MESEHKTIYAHVGYNNNNEQAETPKVDKNRDKVRRYLTFEACAVFSQNAKTAMRATEGWNRNLSDDQKEALELIIGQIGLILAGHAHVLEHWDEIAEAATVISDRIDIDNRIKG